MHSTVTVTLFNHLYIYAHALAPFSLHGILITVGLFFVVEWRVSTSPYLSKVTIYTEHFNSIFEGHIKIAQLLVEYGADVTIRNNKHRTVLHDCAYRGHVEMCKFLIEAGVNVNAEDRDYRSGFFSSF